MATRSKNISRRGPRNRRSLRYATPDFLLRLVALMSFMRLSLTKAAHVALSGAAKQEIRVRFARDDTGKRTIGLVPRYGAPLFGINFPALPGWADVWRSALRALHL